MTAVEDEWLRLFVAIEIGDGVRRALSDVQSELRKCGLGSVRWVRPEGIHLTLKFLGETPAGQVPAIKQALASAVVGVSPHQLTLAGLGAFGSKRSPRVLWVGLEGDTETLAGLQGQVERALETAGFPREPRPFSAHLTLARVRPHEASGVAQVVSEVLSSVRVAQAALDVREVSLMRSQLGAGGAVYSRLDAFALR